MEMFILVNESIFLRTMMLCQIGVGLSCGDIWRLTVHT